MVHQRGQAGLPVLAEVEGAGDGLVDGGVVAAMRGTVLPEDAQLAGQIVAEFRVRQVEQVAGVGTRMEAGGLLFREPHPSDRRLVRLRLTERGRSLEDAIATETDRLTERALASFGPAERQAIISALTAIRRNLTTG